MRSTTTFSRRLTKPSPFGAPTCLPIAAREVATFREHVSGARPKCSSLAEGSPTDYAWCSVAIGETKDPQRCVMSRVRASALIHQAGKKSLTPIAADADPQKLDEVVGERDDAAAHIRDSELIEARGVQLQGGEPG